VLPAVGSQVNVSDPDELEEPGDEPDPAGTTTVQDPASPSVAFTTVWLASDCRVTTAVEARYPLLAVPEAAGPRRPKAPAASAAPAATSTTTTAAATQRPRRRRDPPGARPPP
jgi:hypothetical protein